MKKLILIVLLTVVSAYSSFRWYETTRARNELYAETVALKNAKTQTDTTTLTRVDTVQAIIPPAKIVQDTLYVEQHDTLYKKQRDTIVIKDTLYRSKRVYKDTIVRNKDSLSYVIKTLGKLTYFTYTLTAKNNIITKQHIVEPLIPLEDNRYRFSLSVGIIALDKARISFGAYIRKENWGSYYKYTRGNIHEIGIKYTLN